MLIAHILMSAFAREASAGGRVIRMIFIILIFFATTAYTSDQQGSIIDKLVSAGKKETFNTTKPTLLDQALKKQYEILAKTDPEKFNKLVAYEQKKEILDAQHSSTPKRKK